MLVIIIVDSVMMCTFVSGLLYLIGMKAQMGILSISAMYRLKNCGS